MRLRVGQEFRQAALQLRGLLRTQVREQFFLELPCYGDGLCEQALARSGQRDSQDATMLGSFPTFNQSLTLEGSDQIAIPALSMAQEDSERGVLTRNGRAEISETLREIVESLGEETNEATEAAALPPPAIECLGARNELDDAAAILLVLLLADRKSVV